MVEFELTINKSQQTVYFSNHIIDIVGYEVGVQLMTACGVIYPLGMPKTEIIRSLKNLIADLEHQVEFEQKSKDK